MELLPPPLHQNDSATEALEEAQRRTMEMFIKAKESKQRVEKELAVYKTKYSALKKKYNTLLAGYTRLKKKHKPKTVAGAGAPPKSQRKPKSDYATAATAAHNGWDSDSPTQQVQSATVRSVSVSPATDLTPVPIFESPLPSAKKSASRKGAGWAVPPRDSRILSSSGRKPKSLQDRKTQSSSSRGQKTIPRQVKSAELTSARNRPVCSRKSASASTANRHRSTATTTTKGGHTALDPICLFDTAQKQSVSGSEHVAGLDAQLPDSDDVGLSVSQPQPDVLNSEPPRRANPELRRHVAAAAAAAATEKLEHNFRMQRFLLASQSQHSPSSQPSPPLPKNPSGGKSRSRVRLSIEGSSAQAGDEIENSGSGRGSAKRKLEKPPPAPTAKMKQRPRSGRSFAKGTTPTKAIQPAAVGSTPQPIVVKNKFRRPRQAKMQDPNVHRVRGRGANVCSSARHMFLFCVGIRF
eukprot:INCI15887.2.p1 GENE.INCI15887.2~~INCI15887.2.p1  ORF type:complete len:466 (+),score=51.35 INCI15887.2:120-1517(+)